mmetsp:Transcript_5371/g.11794  ORF Transcript_5371/g.11794 Transcript_5371/m.11794 type:complete len:292 (+) Transcript_5371:34-909(+)
MDDETGPVLAREVLANRDTLALVLMHLDSPQDLCRCARVCRLWKDCADTSRAWEHLIQTLPASQANKKLQGLGLQPRVLDVQPHITSDTTPKQRYEVHLHWHSKLGALGEILGDSLLQGPPDMQVIDQLASAEQRQTAPFPKAWKRWRAIPGIIEIAELLHNWEEQGIFFVNKRVEVLPAPQFLQHIGKYIMRFYSEDQGCCYWYCIFDEGWDDPPVLWSLHNLTEANPRLEALTLDGEETFLHSNHFTTFWLHWWREGLQGHRESHCAELSERIRRRLGTVHPWMLEGLD